MEDLKKVIADNIIFYRKEKGYTQLELAEKLNYSDKAVSKWERAESLPDVITLNEIASMLDVTLNDLVSVKKKVRIRKPLTVCFSVGLVWLVATVVFVLINILTKSSERSWLVFLYAIPASSILLIVFTSIWHYHLGLFVSESVLIWSLAAAIFLSLSSYAGMFYIFFLPIPLQSLAALWYIRGIRKRGK